jgi:hypothetical protein
VPALDDFAVPKMGCNVQRGGVIIIAGIEACPASHKVRQMKQEIQDSQSMFEFIRNFLLPAMSNYLN